jgi:hypothetical protein
MQGKFKPQVRPNSKTNNLTTTPHGDAQLVGILPIWNVFEWKVISSLALIM